MRPRLIIVTGATAAGKSAFIYEHLQNLPLTVINADSRQVYRDITIASASPTSGDLQKFPHALYNFLPVTETFSAGEFMRQAKTEIAKAHAAGRIPLICGGTYFYLHALLYGLLPSVEIPDEVRERVEALSGPEAYAELMQCDAVAARQNHPHNVSRVQRALMLCHAHRGPISALQKTGGIAEDFEILMLVFDSERTVLRERIRHRVDAMLAAGLVGEIQGLMTQGDLNAWRQVPALTGIGIREFIETYESMGKYPTELSGDDLAHVRDLICQNSIHLVKRQQTWYRNARPQPANTKTVDPSYENGLIAALVKDFVSFTENDQK